MYLSQKLRGWSKKEDDLILSSLKNGGSCKAIGKKLIRPALSVLVRYKYLMRVRDGVLECGESAGVKHSF